MKLTEHLFSTTVLNNAVLNVLMRSDITGKTQRLVGLDGVKMQFISTHIPDIIEQVKQELYDKQTLHPVEIHHIPKKNGGGTRIIYNYTIADRVKSEALKIVLIPLFEQYVYSPFLYSYRSTHPHYKALQSVCKRYRYATNDVFYRGDICNYTDDIDHQTLIHKLSKLPLEDDIIHYLKLFIGNPIYTIHNNTPHIERRSIGLLQGVSLMTLFSNIYLSELDKTIGKQCHLYRRVGDDILLLDSNEAKIQRLKETIEDYCTTHKLTLHPVKSRIGTTQNDSFTFLGYDFIRGIITINNKSLQRKIQDYTAPLQYNNAPLQHKLKHLKAYIHSYESGLLLHYKQFLRDYKYITHHKIYRFIDTQVFIKIAKYLYKNINKQTCTETYKHLKSMNYTGLNDMYRNFITHNNG